MDGVVLGLDLDCGLLHFGFSLVITTVEIPD
jgi:hypothetical protein